MADTLSDLVEKRFGLPSTAGADLPANNLVGSMLNHRTQRRYTDDPIPPDRLELIFAAALSSPSKSDLQQVSIIRVTDMEKRRAIGANLPSMPWIVEAPEFFVFCGDTRRIRRVTELRGKSYENDTLDTVLNTIVDAALVMQGFITAAAALGYGTCPISHIRDHMAFVGDLLELPDYVFPVAGLCLGAPSAEGFVSLRLPASATVHENAYDDDKMESEVDSYDRRRDAVFSIPEEKYKAIDRFGAPDFYGWSEDKARMMASADPVTLRDYLTAKGFALK